MKYISVFLVAETSVQHCTFNPIYISQRTFLSSNQLFKIAVIHNKLISTEKTCLAETGYQPKYRVVFMNGPLLIVA